MRRVLKYAVPVDDQVHEFDLPIFGHILHIGMQDGDVGTVYFWMEVNDTEPTQKAKYTVVGTGHEMPEKSVAVDSVQAGPFVWHLLEVWD